MKPILQHLNQNIQGYLTVIWLCCFAASVLVVNSYVGRIGENGIYLVPPDERWDCLQPLVLLFSGYIGGILAFWFIKPFKPHKQDVASAARSVIALACTLGFAIVILYLVAQPQFHPDQSIPIAKVATDAALIASKLSFLVAPINFYYFGMRMPR